MGIYNNVPGKTSKVNTKNKVVPDEPSKPKRREKEVPMTTRMKNIVSTDKEPSKGTKVIPAEKSKAPTKVADISRPRNVVGSEVTNINPRRSVMGANDVDAGSPPPVQRAPAATQPVVTKTPVVKAPVARTPVESASSRAARQAAYDDWKRSQAELGAPGMKKGGSVKSSASSRGDGCAQRGKTRGRFV